MHEASVLGTIQQINVSMICQAWFALFWKMIIRSKSFDHLSILVNKFLRWRQLIILRPSWLVISITNIDVLARGLVQEREIRTSLCFLMKCDFFLFIFTRLLSRFLGKSYLLCHFSRYFKITCELTTISTNWVYGLL